jgi:PIN domain nuclease of toxin-antitoxin system
LSEVAVLDSSAVLALLQNEAGSSIVGPLVFGALISAVNLTEVYSKLILKGLPASLCWPRIVSLQCEVCPYTGEQARAAAELIQVTKPYGLSLGDRACIALAIDRKATVYTTDKIWKSIRLGIKVEVIR